ncbi:hypothetical protein CNY89_05700 [Amaricoccus sp. HAR-UPW-R2A-40]|nr:hypothetical protein CNY89_05700 [Amaricoccus sp. HAR-UPW-R2A-40]
MRVPSSIRRRSFRAIGGALFPHVLPEERRHALARRRESRRRRFAAASVDVEGRRRSAILLQIAVEGP